LRLSAMISQYFTKRAAGQSRTQYRPATLVHRGVDLIDS
jgi:hypothetical protein